MEWRREGLCGDKKQIERTKGYNEKIKSIDGITSLLLKINEEEAQRFKAYRKKIIEIAVVINLTKEILAEAINFEASPYSLSSQDAIVYASVLTHLRSQKIQDMQDSCFINKNTKDFFANAIKTELEKYHCHLIGKFNQGLDFLKKQKSS